MLTELTEYYSPKEILHRDEQINEVKKIFSNFKKNGMASNVILLGVTGSGKTTIINKIIKEENNCIFGSCSITATTFRTLRAMFDLNCGTKERLLSEIIFNLKANPKILIIDEVNKVEDVNSLFNSLNTIYRETGVPIIIITNKRTILDEIPVDAKLTLFFERLDFPAYNSLELYDIVKDRIKSITQKIPKMPDGALKLICAIGGKDASARIVLSITLKCILADNFTEKFIYKMRDDLEKEDWKDFLAGLRTTEKEFLKNIMELQNKKKEFTPSDISRSMERFTPARISQLISTFENYGILDSKYKNLGRGGGRKRVICISSEEIYDKLAELI